MSTQQTAHLRLFLLVVFTALCLSKAAKPKYPKLEGECASTNGGYWVGLDKLTTRAVMAKFQDGEWTPEVGVSHVRPSDVPGSRFGPPLDLYCNWTSVEMMHGAAFKPAAQASNGTGVRDKPVPVFSGSIRFRPPLQIETKFYNLRSVVHAAEVSAILDIMQDPAMIYDVQPDTVDQETAHEIFVFNGEKGLNYEESQLLKAREPARQALSKIMNPILDERITPLVRQLYPSVCTGRPDRGCTPCYSLVRKYRPGERRSHAIHRDGQAILTVVVSLSDYGTEYTGGLYISAGEGRLVVPLNRGDAVVHQYDLLHGVDVTGAGERWSWILWYKDSERCEQFGYQWSRACAQAGDALCQYLYGWRVHLDPALSDHDKAHQRELWMGRSAEQRFPEAMFKTARNALGRREYGAGLRLLEEACRAGDADACFQRGQLQLMLAAERSHGEDAGTAGGGGWAARESALALSFFEAAAAAGSSPTRGAAYAMYNLGVARLFGMGGQARDPAEAAEWFESSGLPEGLMAVSHHRAAAGHAAEAQAWADSARSMGFGSAERRLHLAQVGYSLHSPWPEVKLGMVPAPPEW